MIAIALLVVVITDSLLATYFLPGFLSSRPDITSQQRRVIFRIINACTLVFAAVALLIYITQIAG
jgi:hypothetical protein